MPLFCELHVMGVLRLVVIKTKITVVSYKARFTVMRQFDPTLEQLSHQKSSLILCNETVVIGVTQVAPTEIKFPALLLVQLSCDLSAVDCNVNPQVT